MQPIGPRSLSEPFAIMLTKEKESNLLFEDGILQFKTGENHTKASIWAICLNRH